MEESYPVVTELLALPGNSPSIENYRFPGKMFTRRNRVTRLVLSSSRQKEAASRPSEMNILPCKRFARETRQAGRNFCQQCMHVFSFHVKLQFIQLLLHVTTVY